MPIYELICTKCDHEQEVICSYSERKNQKCEKCGKKKMISKISLHNFLGTTEGKGRYYG